MGTVRTDRGDRKKACVGKGWPAADGGGGSRSIIRSGWPAIDPALYICVAFHLPAGGIYAVQRRGPAIILSSLNLDCTLES